MRASKVSLEILLFLTWFASSVFAETCPHPEDIIPCNCAYDGTHSDIIVTCRRGTLDEIEGALSHLHGRVIKELNFKNVKLGRISSVFFWGLNINKLHFDNCELDSVADGIGKPAFVGLDNSLEELSISYGFRSNNTLTHLNLSHLRKLRALSLTRNNIPAVGDDWFNRGPGSLAELNLSNNDIRDISDRAFVSLGNLRRVALSGNRLKRVKRSMLPRPARVLIELNLSENSLSSLPDDMFVDMPALKHVYLTSNLLQRITPKTWSTVWEKLDQLYLEKNPLECDSHLDWLLKVKRPEDMTGTCDHPKEKRGIHLKDLIDAELNTTLAVNHVMPLKATSNLRLPMLKYRLP